LRLLGQDDQRDDHLEEHEQEHEVVMKRAAMNSQDGEGDTEHGVHDGRVLGHIGGQGGGGDDLVQVETLPQVFFFSEHKVVGTVAGEKLLFRIIQVISSQRFVGAEIR